MRKPDEGPGEFTDFFDPDCPLCRAMQESGSEIFPVGPGAVAAEVRDLEEIVRIIRSMEGKPGTWTFISERRG